MLKRGGRSFEVAQKQAGGNQNLKITTSKSLSRHFQSTSSHFVSSPCNSTLDAIDNKNQSFQQEVSYNILDKEVKIKMLAKTMKK